MAEGEGVDDERVRTAEHRPKHAEHSETTSAGTGIVHRQYTHIYYSTSTTVLLYTPVYQSCWRIRNIQWLKLIRTQVSSVQNHQFYEEQIAVLTYFKLSPETDALFWLTVLSLLPEARSAGG